MPFSRYELVDQRIIELLEDAGERASVLLSLPVVLYNAAIQGWFGYTAPRFVGSDWIAPALGTAIFV